MQFLYGEENVEGETAVCQEMVTLYNCPVIFTLLLVCRLKKVDTMFNYWDLDMLVDRVLFSTEPY